MILLLIYVLSIIGTILAYSVYEEELKDFKHTIDLEKTIILISFIPFINTILTIGFSIDLCKNLIKEIIKI